MGKVYLVGAGPGAPDLLTIRAARLLKEADIVFYDALVHPDTIALATKAKKVAVGKRAGQLSTDQRFINRTLVEAGLRHECVVRLKGGDPMLFGRAQEEIDALGHSGVAVEVVPGVTAALAAAASLTTSLTKRGVSRSVTFATPRVGHGEETGDWAEIVSASDTAILYMAIGEAEEVRGTLINRGVSPDTPIVIVENASLPGERHIRGALGNLSSIARERKIGPAILCIGRVFESESAFSDDAARVIAAVR
jgi:uroporphyrin-III C-methyltransferase